MFLSQKYRSNHIKLKHNEPEKISCNVGYRTILGECGLERGSFYFEVILKNSVGGVRVGFTGTERVIDGPMGVEKESYAIGSANGYIFNDSTRIKYAYPFKKGDVVGCYCFLSEGESVFSDRFDEVIERKGSYISFSINGEDLGVAYYGIKGIMWPGISLSHKAKVHVNFAAVKK